MIKWTPPAYDDSNRTTRYAGILPTDKLRTSPVTVIGCGAIGSGIARELATVGVERFVLYDFDDVDGVNLGPQGYCPHQVGTPKVHALAEDITRLNPSAQIVFHNNKVIPGTRIETPTVFSCVDSISARRDVYTSARRSNCVDYLFDVRMAAFSFDLYSVKVPSDWYDETLRNRTSPEVPCTERNTRQCALMAVATVLQQYHYYLKDYDPDPVINCAVNAYEFCYPDHTQLLSPA